MRRPSRVWWCLGLVLFGCDPAGPHRLIVTDRWDSAAWVVPTSEEDTTLLVVSQILSWGQDLVVRDGENRNIRRISPNGEILWSYEERGEGPGEVRSLLAMRLAPTGNLWIHDRRGGKILELGPDGRFERERSLQHLPVVPTNFGFVGDRVVFSSSLPDPFLMVLDTGTMEIQREIPFPWVDSLPRSFNFRSSVDSWGDVLVVGLELGPGFIVFDKNQLQYHPYVEAIPWAEKANPRLTAARADSARFGAVSVSVDSTEIHMLFGGRPIRAAHPAEPTKLVDVYGLDGSYLRSYELPSHFKQMARSGGSYILYNESEVGLPQIRRFSPIVPRDSRRGPE